MLADLHATADTQEVPEYCLVVTPQEGSRYKELWSEECKEKIHSFLNLFLEVSIPCPYDLYDAVMMIVNDDKSVRHNLSMDVKNIVLVGYREDVSHLKDSIMRYVQKNHRGSESMNLSPDKLAYIHHFLRSELERCHQVKFTINMKTRTVEVKGIVQNCKEFLLKVENLSPPSKIISIPPVQRRFLTRPSGHDALLNLISAKGCHFFFTQEDNTIHLVAENDQSLRIGERILENYFSVSDLTVPPLFAKFSRSVEWSSTREKIESKFTAAVDVSPSADKVYVASLLDQSEEVLKVLKAYIQNKCSRTATIPLEPAHWRYLRSSQVWTDIQKQLCNVNYSLPEKGDDPNPQIVLTGDADVVNVLQTKIDKFCTQITKQEAKVSTPGAARYLSTYHGGDQLEKVQHAHDALVEWEELPDEVLSVPVEELPGYKQATLVCTCKAPGGVSLYVKAGDLTVYPADVLVNSANGNLTLTGQLSAMFAAQGGSAIQRKCTNYVQQHGRLQPGEAVIFKNTGELPSKAIVHTVGPKEGDGNQEVLSQAVQNSLEVAEGYISIAFPALGTGNYKVEGSISSEGMLRGIHSYFKDHPRSSLKEVVIMLHYDRNDLAMDFVGTMQQIFKDVMTPLGVHVLGGSHNRRPSVNKPRRTVQRPALSSMLKYTSHEVNVEVVRGNLSGDDSTGYIAMEDPGSSLESMHQRSLRPNRVIVRRVEKRKLFFVSQPSTHKECEDTVSLVLEKAEEEGLRSFTIVDELAEKCCHGSERVNTIRHGIDSFLATRVHKNLETIKIYVTMKNTLFSAPTRRSDVKLQVYCLSQKAAEHAMEEVLAAINKACDSVKISEPVISTMSCKMEDMLKREAKERGVSIHVSKSDNSITISGVRDDVKAMKIIVDAEIRKLTARGRVISKVKWQWKNDDCAYQDYSTETSDAIEADYQSKIAFFFVLTEDGEKCIDFDKMTETGAVSITNVRRHDFEKEGNIPSRWDHCDEPIKCFPLDKDSKEFVDVARQFALTVPSTEGGGVKFGRIKQIERVQNLRCWKRFQAELQRKRHDVADDQQIQHRLFCGCSGEKVDSVNGGEFTKTNQGWGTGAYFSKDASYVCTQVFAPKDGEGVRHVYLCSVVTGDYAQGVRKFREPPLKDGNGSDHYDTVVNDMNEPTVFVVFRDSLAYPEYHIEFSQ
jgi:poly [ADP-ribose] polymerase 10/14/15